MFRIIYTRRQGDKHKGTHTYKVYSDIREHCIGHFS